MSTKATIATRLLIAACTCALLFGCAVNRPSKPPSVFLPPCNDGSTICLYRGVSAKSNGNASLGPGTFKFNPGLSTFNYENGGSKPPACFFVFSVTNPRPGTPVAPMTQLPVNGLTDCEAIFDDTPPGHWDILRSPQCNENVVSAYAQSHRTDVANGSNSHCY